MKALSVLMMLFIFLSNGLFAKNVDREKELRIINEEIKRLNLPWKTADHYTEYELGAILPLDRKKVVLKEISKTAALPASLDWRNYNGQNYISPVKNQGNCGSCWAFGTVGTMEAIWKIEQQRSDLNPDLSEQDLVSCSTAGSCSGGWHFDAIEWVRQHGILPEYCFSYYASNMPCIYCNEGNQIKTTVQGWDFITNEQENVAAIKQALITGPVATTMEVYSDFYYYSSGVYVRTPSSSIEGLHVVVIVGYDDSLHCWIAKNSWGPGFGESGFFRIRWLQAGLGESNGGLDNIFGPYTISVNGVTITKVAGY